jgi:hypothetical protein
MSRHANPPLGRPMARAQAGSPHGAGAAPEAASSASASDPAGPREGPHGHTHSVPGRQLHSDLAIGAEVDGQLMARARPGSPRSAAAAPAAASDVPASLRASLTCIDLAGLHGAEVRTGAEVHTPTSGTSGSASIYTGSIFSLQSSAVQPHLPCKRRVRHTALPPAKRMRLLAAVTRGSRGGRHSSQRAVKRQQRARQWSQMERQHQPAAASHAAAVSIAAATSPHKPHAHALHNCTPPQLLPSSADVEADSLQPLGAARKEELLQPLGAVREEGLLLLLSAAEGMSPLPSRAVEEADSLQLASAAEGDHRLQPTGADGCTARPAHAATPHTRYTNRHRHWPNPPSPPLPPVEEVDSAEDTARHTHTATPHTRSTCLTCACVHRHWPNPPSPPSAGLAVQTLAAAEATRAAVAAVARAAARGQRMPDAPPDVPPPDVPPPPPPSTRPPPPILGAAVAQAGELVRAARVASAAVMAVAARRPSPGTPDPTPPPVAREATPPGPPLGVSMADCSRCGTRFAVGTYTGQRPHCWPCRSSPLPPPPPPSPPSQPSAPAAADPSTSASDEGDDAASSTAQQDPGSPDRRPPSTVSTVSHTCHFCHRRYPPRPHRTAICFECDIARELGSGPKPSKPRREHTPQLYAGPRQRAVPGLPVPGAPPKPPKPSKLRRPDLQPLRHVLKPEAMAIVEAHFKARQNPFPPKEAKPNPPPPPQPPPPQPPPPPNHTARRFSAGDLLGLTEEELEARAGEFQSLVGSGGSARD